MTEQERQEVKARLIEFGLWGADEPGDATADYQDALTLHNRVEGRLAGNVILFSMCLTTGSLARKIEATCGEFTYELGAADNYPEAICLAALALPQFLKQHPECAAAGDPEEREASTTDDQETVAADEPPVAKPKRRSSKKTATGKAKASLRSKKPKA